MAVNNTAKFPVPPEVRSRLVELRQQLSSSAAKRLLWTTLTQQEQTTIDTELFGSEVDFEPSAIQMWTYLRDVHIEPGIVGLAAWLNFITFGEHKWLQESLSPIAEPSNEKQALDVEHAPPKPSWDNQTDKLWYDGNLVRKVRFATNCKIRKLLQRFEEQGWPTVIKYPPELQNSAPASSLLRSLNRGLTKIKFRSRTGDVRGEELIFWEPVDEGASATNARSTA